MSTSNKSVENITQQLYNTVSNDMSFEDKANEVLEIGRQFLGADDAYISLVDQEIEHCEIAVSTYGPDGTFPTGMKPDLSKTYCRRTVEADEPIALHNAPEQGWEDDPAYDAHELECYFGTKLFLSDDLDGTVCFVGDEGRREPFTGEELLLIKLISQILTHELERKNHRAELERYDNLVNIINRVLRHNLRNDMSVIRGHTQMMAEQLTDDTDGKVALEKIDDLIRLGEKARELEEVVIEDKDRTQTDIGALVRSVVNDVKADFPHASVVLDITERATAAVSPSFEQALKELIENAAKHGGETPSVMISVAVDANAVEITIEDDGPGLSRQEQQVLTAGIETPLVHGSGLGLWLAHWVVTDHDGSIESTVTDDGTVMRVSVPRSTATSATRDEADLERARDQYQAAFEEAFDAVYILNDDARIIKANPAAGDIYGLDPAELRGRSVMEFLPDGYSGENAQKFIQQSNTEQETVTITSANGAKRIIEFSTTANIVSGQHLVIARDVTDRVEREQQLAEAQKAFENTQDAMFLIDVTDSEEFTIQRVNEGYESMTGLANEEIQGKTPREAVGEEIGRKIETQYQTCVERGEAIEYPEQIPVDGELRHWRTRVTPIIDDGTVVKLVGAMRDVTEQKEQQQALQTERERFEQLLDTSPVGMAILDHDGSFVRANERAEEILGLSESEITDREYDTPEWELISADGTPMPSDELPFHQVMQTGEPVYDYVHGIKIADGTRRWLSINAAPLTDDDGAIERVIAAITDITDQKRRQRELKRYETVLQTGTDSAWVFDEDKRLTFVNDTFLKQVSLTREEALGMPLAEFRDFFADDETFAEWNSLVEDVTSGPVADGEIDVEATLATGRTILNLQVTELTHSEGAVVVARDITRRKQREEELAELKQRYEAMIEAAPNPAFVAEYESGELLETNAAAAEMLGKPRESIVGQHQSELHPDEQSAVYEEFFETEARADEPLRELPDGSPIHVVTSSGERIPVEINVDTVELDSGRVVLAFFRDLTGETQQTHEG